MKPAASTPGEVRRLRAVRPEPEVEYRHVTGTEEELDALAAAVARILREIPDDEEAPANDDEAR